MSEVLKATYIAAPDARFAPMALIEWNLPGALYLLHESLVLQRAQVLTRQRVDGFEIIGRGREFSPQSFEVEGAVIPGDALRHVSYTETSYR
jgi:hypothetical protein